MGITAQGSLFASGSHASYRGALAADRNRAKKTRRYLELLYARGPQTDWQAAQALHCERTSINSIRANCIACGLVTKGFTTRPGSDGKTPNSTWTLTSEGTAAVLAIKAAS